MISLGYNIKLARERAGMSQVELSKKSGVSRVTIWALETVPDYVTTTKTLYKIAEALNTTVDALFSPGPSA